MPVLVVSGCTGERRADLGRPPATQAVEEARESAAGSLVGDLEQVLTGSSTPDSVSTTRLGATAELRAAAANVRSLRLREVSLRFLAPSSSSLTDVEQTRLGGDAWLGDVQVSWRQPEVADRPALLTVPMIFAGVGDRQRFVSFRAEAADHVPLWLLVRLAVVRAPRSTAVAPDRGAAARLSALAEQAVATVRQTLPRWTGRLLVQQAPSQQAFQVSAGLPAQQARAVAAVTTTADGSGGRTSRGQVFVNPRLYAPLDRNGRQIVVSHEAAHVALGAATTRMPLWLSEGAADWIALRRSSLPVERLAGQVLDWVRKNGGPRALPGPGAFDGSDQRIGAWYEAAWLAVKRLGDTYGPDRLLRFYRRTERTGAAGPAFRNVLGTTQEAFERDWRAYLASLA